MENNQLNGERHKFTDWESLILPIALIGGLVAFLLLGLGEEILEPELETVLEPNLRLAAAYAASIVEGISILVIGIAVIGSLFHYLRLTFWSVKDRNEFIKVIQLNLGRAMALGLEFLIAGDILRTAVAPTQHQILRLGAIVLLRTLLNYFLEHEMHQVEKNTQLDKLGR
ncbi:MAG TPA: DUF1622 domain-containing protein [Levilinea sp.]|nr:DUF1622 domain-containing protein [Levilinea sp.]